jgi:hypothetical protein
MSITTVSITLSPYVPSLPNDLIPWDFYIRNLNAFFCLFHGVQRVTVIRTLRHFTVQSTLAAKWLSIPNLVPIRQLLNVTKLRPRGEDNTVGLLYILSQ